MAKDAPGMKGLRSRNESGPLRAKRGDTLVGTIERQYGVDDEDGGSHERGLEPLSGFN